MNLTLAGVRATDVEIRVPQIGAWVADVSLDTATAIQAGRVTLAVGAANFVGTVDPKFSGSFGGRRMVRLVAGGNGWGQSIPARHFHNDAGVKDKTVIQAAADAVGETLAFDATPASVGPDYVRKRDVAAAVLRKLGVPWWVDYAGVTHVGTRTPAKLGKFDVLEFNARENVATLGTTDAQAVGIGATITANLDAPLVVRQLVIRVNAESARVLAWGTTT